ncbi:MAG: hypothetical protein Q7S10_03335 [bacterium]|nr:hypothetical protein [bacterium]
MTYPKITSFLFIAVSVLAAGAFLPTSASAATPFQTRFIDPDQGQIESTYKNPSVIRMPQKPTPPPIKFAKTEEKISMLSHVHGIVVGITALVIASMTLFLAFTIASSQRLVRKLVKTVPRPVLIIRKKVIPLMKS